MRTRPPPASQSTSKAAAYARRRGRAAAGPTTTRSRAGSRRRRGWARCRPARPCRAAAPRPRPRPGPRRRPRSGSTRSWSTTSYPWSLPGLRLQQRREVDPVDPEVVQVRQRRGGVVQVKPGGDLETVGAGRDAHDQDELLSVLLLSGDGRGRRGVGGRSIGRRVLAQHQHAPPRELGPHAGPDRALAAPHGSGVDHDVPGRGVLLRRQGQRYVVAGGVEVQQEVVVDDVLPAGVGAGDAVPVEVHAERPRVRRVPVGVLHRAAVEVQPDDVVEPLAVADAYRRCR